MAETKYGKYILKNPTKDFPPIIYIPKGMRHCPLNYRVVHQPFYCLDIFLSRNTSKKGLPIVTFPAGEARHRSLSLNLPKSWRFPVSAPSRFLC